MPSEGGGVTGGGVLADSRVLQDTQAEAGCRGVYSQHLKEFVKA
jgi:hypothetical protein